MPQKDKKILDTIAADEKKLLEKEKIIAAQTEKLVKINTFLESQEKKELIEEKKIEKELTFFQKFFIHKVKTHKLLFQFLIAVGVVLVWRGLWGIFDQTPFLSSFFVSVAAGLLLLWLLNKLTELN